MYQDGVILESANPEFWCYTRLRDRGAAAADQTSEYLHLMIHCDLCTWHATHTAQILEVVPTNLIRSGNYGWLAAQLAASLQLLAPILCLPSVPSPP